MSDWPNRFTTSQATPRSTDTPRYAPVPERGYFSVPGVGGAQTDESKMEKQIVGGLGTTRGKVPADTRAALYRPKASYTVK